MDFGDILDRWESGDGSRRKKDLPPKGKNGVRREKSEKRPNGMEAVRFEKLLELYPPGQAGSEDKDGTSSEPREDAASWKRMRVQATLDLHGMTAQQARNALVAFMTGARSRGLRKVMIIHGKGVHSETEPVLSRIVREYLEKCPFAGKTGTPERSEGGNGAVWVILRQDYRSR